METAELTRLVQDDAQLKEKILKALGDSEDDSDAAYRLHFQLYLSEEDRKALKLSSYDEGMKIAKALIAAVKEQEATEAVPGDESYVDVLSSLTSTRDRCDYNDKLMFLNYTNGSEQGKTHFVRTGDVEGLFRHGGERDAIPPLVYVTVAGCDDMVHVYNQHSGVGKTVELCSSAYIRGAHLTIFHEGSEEDDIEMDHERLSAQDLYIARKTVAEMKVKAIVGDAVARNNDIFYALKERCGISKELKLILAIDEASTCRTLVRAITRDPDDLGVAAALEIQRLLGWEVKISVRFSVAGTGSAAADIGSKPKHFFIVTPSISRSPESVYEALRGEYRNLPTYKELKGRCPVLFTFVQYNARFCSIVLKVFPKEGGGGHYTDGLLVRKVVESFLKSNGISDIAGNSEELARAGARTLAVHLFQKEERVPENEKERRELADSYDYGVSLQATKLKQKETMTELIHKYGLVIALPFGNDHQRKKRYTVDSAMQLLSFFMMGLSPEIDLLESSSFGYEVLSTHIVKCAIASTLEIPEGVRPSIQAALKEIGFGLNNPHATISSEDDFADYALWESLGRMIAIHGEYDVQYRETRQHRQEMVRKKVEQQQFHVLGVAGFVARDVGGEEYLLVDRELIDELHGMQPCSMGNRFWPPLATVAKGSSPYADGYVSFLAKGSGPLTLCTIMVQAKDYFSSSINFKELKENVERCRSQEISLAFGKCRLMCVASRHDKMVGDCEHFRDFIMFSTNKSSLLSDLMDALDAQRNSATLHDFTGGIPITSSNESERQKQSRGDDVDNEERRRRKKHPQKRKKAKRP